MPYQNAEEERHEPGPPLLTTPPPSDDLSEKLETSLSHILSTSLANIDLQSNQTEPHPGDFTESSKTVVVRHDEEPKATEETTVLEEDTQLRYQPSIPSRFHIPYAPTAPVLYPSVATLEESSVIYLREDSVKDAEREPAVLALPEQESSPPSLQPLESVAEISRSKLYPELPKTAPEMQVIMN